MPIYEEPVLLDFVRGDATGLAIPAGEHRVEWTERAPGLAASAWGPVLFAAAAAALLRRVPARNS